MAKNLLNDKEIYALRMARWRARTDLEFLCREVLGYKDVCRSVHGPVIDILQKFPPPTREQFRENDVWTGSTWIYTPLLPMQDLPGGRRRLILDPRGHLKTTINAQAHVIQWILNYPDIAIAIFQSNTDKAIKIIGEIKRHFQYNPIFRKLFPEHCPQKNVDDFGVLGEFTSASRGRHITRKEPTVMGLSIDKGTAGLHFEVMKFSDIVEPENVKLKERSEAIKDAFYVAESLLVSPVYWIDVEGTRYTFNDLYATLIDNWFREALEKRPHEYLIHARSVFKRTMPDGTPQTTFTPDLLELPFEKDENGKRIPWWPKDASGQPRFTLEALEAMQRNSPYIFSSQQLNNPVGGADGREIFPVSATLPIRITNENFRKNVRLANITTTVDTAETQGQRSNYSAIVTVGWDGFGRAYVMGITHGKFLPDELINKIFEVNKRFKPTRLVIEETSFVRGLFAGLQRQQDLTGIYLPLEFVKPDNQQRKTERIQNTLQPWYIQGLLRFVEPREADTEYKKALDHLMKELKTFPLGNSDDILDALANQFQGKEWFGREFPRMTAGEREEMLNNSQVYSFDGLEEHIGKAKLPFSTNSALEMAEITPNYSVDKGFYDSTGGL